MAFTTQPAIVCVEMRSEGMLAFCQLRMNLLHCHQIHIDRSRNFRDGHSERNPTCQTDLIQVNINCSRHWNSQNIQNFLGSLFDNGIDTQIQSRCLSIVSPPCTYCNADNVTLSTQSASVTEALSRHIEFNALLRTFVL